MDLNSPNNSEKIMPETSNSLDPLELPSVIIPCVRDVTMMEEDDMMVVNDEVEYLDDGS